MTAINICIASEPATDHHSAICVLLEGERAASRAEHWINEVRHTLGDHQHDSSWHYGQEIACLGCKLTRPSTGRINQPWRREDAIGRRHLPKSADAIDFHRWSSLVKRCSIALGRAAKGGDSSIGNSESIVFDPNPS